MSAASDLAPPSDLAAMVLRVHRLLDGRPDCPSPDEVREACNVLYSASLLKEEGRPVRARVILAPPEAFAANAGPPDGIHAVRFTSPHPFSANEIKRLSPAASFFHSVVAVWPDRDRGFRIWLLFYHGYQLLSEWRGREFHGPRLDVFQSPMLSLRFLHLRRGLVQEVSECCLPPAIGIDDYAELSHLISLQFVKRIVNLVRTSGHGGSLVMLPAGDAGIEAAARWIDCKYTAAPDAAGLRFRHLLQAILRRVGQLCPAGSTLEQSWEIFRHSHDPELDRLEEAFFELARFFSDLMQVDGALVLDQRLCVIGFGGEIRVDRNVIQVEQAHDLDGEHRSDWNVQADGTRHRSVYRLCSVEPKVIGFVISQDSQVRMIANVDESVVFWMHTVV
jgi:hypothetical protein